MRHSVLVTTVALAGLALVPAQAAATHIQCGDTVSGPNVVLHSDLNCTGSVGLIVAGRNTNLSLNNHTIDGVETGTGLIVTGNGVQISGGGPVQDFGTGISLNSVRGVSVTSVQFASNATGASLVAANANLISTNFFNGNLTNGIQLMADSNRNEFFQNTITGTSGGLGTPFGIRVIDGSDGNKVLDNNVSGTSFSNAFPGFGILVGSGAKRTLLDQNDSSSNKGDGFNVSEPTTTLSNNTANNNTRWGFDVIGGIRDGGGNTASSNTLGDCTPAISC